MPDAPRFGDRTEARRRLGDALRDRAIDVDMMLAIPRGGLPLSRAVADALDVPLDIVVASKIGGPGNPELPIGAVASDRTVWRNDEAFYRTRADAEYFGGSKRSRERATESRSLPRRKTRTRSNRGDRRRRRRHRHGLAVRTHLQVLRKTGAAHVPLAVPVGLPETIRELQTIADEVVCLATPNRFGGVGQFDEHFEQISDERSMAYLGVSSCARASATPGAVWI